MAKSISVKGETVEAAVKMALSIMGLTEEEVHVEVISNPKRNLFGLRKMMAEVNVTQIVKPTPSIEKPEDLAMEQYLDRVLATSDIAERKSAMDIPNSKDDEPTGVRIVAGKIDVLFSGENYPMVRPGQNVKLMVNGKQVEEQVMLFPEDELQVTVSDEWIPPQFSIQLIDQEMIAMLTFTPGQKIKRTLRDTEFQQVLVIEADEEIEHYNDVQPQSIVDQLKSTGVWKGLDFAAIKKVTEVDKPYEIIVAKGVAPIEGLDGDLEMHIDYKEKQLSETEKVDFRELNLIVSVEAGKVIATYIPPVPGKDGFNLLGKTIPAKKVRDIVIRKGKNITQIGNDIVAEISGRPAVDRREMLVDIDVNPEHFHKGEVDLESGNIRFEGDVRIGGNVQTSMFVGATGTVYIEGIVTKATVHAMKSAVVRGNVFSSTISVGQQEALIGELTAQLKEILASLEQIQEAIQQVLMIRGNEENDLRTSELNQLIRLLLEKKYTTFQEVNKHFIQKVKNHSQELSSEWLVIADKLYTVFVTSQHKEVKDMNSFVLLVEEVRTLVELYGVKMTSNSLLSVPYAINSVLYSSGMIEVTSKGIYHSSVTAGDGINVQGVCRGGEISASGKVSLQETGSVNVVKTIVRTGEKGSITIGLAHAGTEIYVGNRHYMFMEKKLGVFARLDEEGELLIS